MFTVKSKIDGATTLHEKRQVIIGWPDSAQYDDAMKLKGDADFPVSMIINKPDLFADPQTTEVVEEGYNIVVQRNDNPEGKPIAVILDIDQSNEESSVTTGECTYTFIYKKDSVFVTDANGNTVETIR